MVTLIFLAAGGPAEVAEQFGVNWSSFIAQCVSFLIVAGALYKFAYKPILMVLAERRQRIAESLANAEKIKLELARAEEQRRQLLAEAGAQANRIIEEARKAAEAELAKRSQEAIATAQAILARAREAGQAEVSRLKAELRQEVGRLVVETTAKVTGKVLTLEDHQRLVEETNRELAA